MYRREWRSELDFRDLWRMYEEYEIDARALSSAVRDRLTKRTDLGVPDDVAEQFGDISDIDDFDSAMSDLYDWADREEVSCWIRTF